MNAQTISVFCVAKNFGRLVPRILCLVGWPSIAKNFCYDYGITSKCKSVYVWFSMADTCGHVLRLVREL